MVNLDRCLEGFKNLHGNRLLGMSVKKILCCGIWGWEDFWLVLSARAGVLKWMKQKRSWTLMLALLSEYKCPVMSCLPLLSPCLPSGTDCTFQLVDQTIPTCLVCVRYFITAPKRVTNTVSILIKCWIFHRGDIFPMHHRKMLFQFCLKWKGAKYG